MSFHITKCEPWGLPYTSVLSTIRLYPITSGSAGGSTFVEWSGHYSSDASAGKLSQKNKLKSQVLIIYQLDVVQDGRIKRREALADLAKAVENN